MSGTTIKLNSARLLLLRAAIKNEEQRLQSAASQVARIASGLEMEVAAKANIDASLTKLRKLLKQDAENMATMQSMADLAMSELSKKDEDLANRARNLDGTMRQFASLAAVAGALGTTTTNTSPLLGLSSQIALDAGGKLSDMFGLADRVKDSLITGIGLEGLIGDTSGMYKNNGPGKLSDSSMKDVADLGAASVIAPAGIAGVAGMVAGAAAVGSMTDLWDHVKWMHTSNSGSSNSSGSSKKSKKKKGFLDKIGDAVGGAAGWVGDKISDATDYVGDKISDATDWVGDKLSDAKDAVVDGAKWVGDKAGDVWDGMKKVANSKPVQYLWDMGGSIVGTGADVLSFCGNIVTGEWVDAATDVYGVIDNFFDFSQDLCALTAYGLGAGLDAVGVDADRVRYCYDVAEDYANREGLAGELHAEGLDELGYAVDFIDTTVGAYKTITGFDKLEKSMDNMTWNNMDDVKENLFSLSGWKSSDSLEDLTEIQKTIDQYEAITSNVKLGYKYVDGIVGEDGDGLFMTILKNTTPGKSTDGAIKTMEKYSDLLSAAAGYNDSNSNE